MIANDDLILTFHNGLSNFNLKIATVNGKRSAPEILELMRAVVRDGITVTSHIERSRFAPLAKRQREHVIYEYKEQPRMTAAANGKQSVPLGRPRKTRASFAKTN